MEIMSSVSPDQGIKTPLIRILGESLQEEYVHLTRQEAEAIVEFYCQQNRTDQPLDLRELGRVIAIIKGAPTDIINTCVPLDGNEISKILVMIMRQRFFAYLPIQ